MNINKKQLKKENKTNKVKTKTKKLSFQNANTILHKQKETKINLWIISKL